MFSLLTTTEARRDETGDITGNPVIVQQANAARTVDDQNKNKDPSIEVLENTNSSVAEVTVHELES